MKISIQEVISKAQNGESLEGMAIEDLADTQVKAKDVLLLSRYGIVVPEQNIYYDDKDVAYDPAFDDVKWTRLSATSSLEEQAQIVAEAEQNLSRTHSAIQIELALKDADMSHWAKENHRKISSLLNKFVTDLYEARTLFEK